MKIEFNYEFEGKLKDAIEVDGKWVRQPGDNEEMD